jgi:RNA polymerase sigma-70 factor (ECF subfamily)
MYRARQEEVPVEGAGDDDTDDGTVIAASAAVPECFAAIFDRHAAHIHRYLSRRLGGDAVDDLVAETFLIAFRGRGRYDTGWRSARPWLYGIATNVVSRHRRDEARRYRLRQAVVPEPDETCHADRVAAGVSAEATRGALSAALARLSRGDRDVLLLIAWEDLSYEQVATALGIPVGTVRSRLNRARRKVRAVLGPSDPTETFDDTTFEETRRDG